MLIDNDGHMTCPDCRIPSISYKTIPFNIIKLINFIGLADYAEIERLAVKHDEQNILKRFGDQFLKNFTERELVSERILGSI